MSDLSKDMRLSCEIIGRQLHSTDRFVCDAIEWLTNRPAGVSICRVDESWLVTGTFYASPDESLPSALCGAIEAANAVDEMQAWEAASDEVTG